MGVGLRTITLDKIAGDVNIADLMTKPITGLRFFILRARGLGLPIQGTVPTPTGPDPYPDHTPD